MGLKSGRSLERAKLETKISFARNFLLLMIGLTAVNVVIPYMGNGMYFLFSATLPRFLVTLGCGLMKEKNNILYGIIAALAALVILGVYFLCWIRSRKQHIWLTLALIFFSLDSAVLLVTVLLSGQFSGSLADMLFHGCILYYLMAGRKAGKELLVQEEGLFHADTDDENDERPEERVLETERQTGELEEGQADSKAENPVDDRTDDSKNQPL